MYTKAIAVLWAGVADLAKVIPVGIIASAVPPVAKHRHCWKSESRVEDGEQVQVGAKGTGIVNQHSTCATKVYLRVEECLIAYGY